MFETLLELDRHLFFIINVEWSSPVLDVIMPLVRNKFLWAPLYLFVLSFLLLNFKKNGTLIILYALVTIVISDQLSSTFIKPIFERIRPCNNPVIENLVNLLVSCGSGFSFPSSHAANHFAAAQFFGIILWTASRWVLPLAFVWAGIICYAQVYVGLHYPMDVVGGALLGIIIGSAMAFWCRRFLSKEN